MANRRTFMVQLSLAGSALAGVAAHSQGAMVSEADPQAAALGYKADASKTDKAKFPRYAVGQQCNNCSLYQGKPTDAAGGCPIFAGKQVAGKGWCSAWAKKG